MLNTLVSFADPQVWTVRTKTSDSFASTYEQAFDVGTAHSFSPNPQQPREVGHFILQLNVGADFLWLGKMQSSGSRGFGAHLELIRPTNPKEDPLGWQDNAGLGEDAPNLSAISAERFGFKLHLHFAYSRIPDGQALTDTAIRYTVNKRLATPREVTAASTFSIPWNAIPADGTPYYRTYVLPSIEPPAQINDYGSYFGDFAPGGTVPASGAPGTADFNSSDPDYHPIKMYGLRVSGPYRIGVSTTTATAISTRPGRTRSHFA